MKTNSAITPDASASEPITTQFKKSPTGIKGFDEITFGGLPTNRPTVIFGSSGTGKTVMAMEFILNGAGLFNESGLFLTFEERVEDIIVNASSLGYNLQKFITEKKVLVEHLNISNSEIHEVGKYNLDGLFVILGHAIEKINAKRIVLDSFDTLFSNFDTRILRAEFKKLFLWLKEKKLTAIITAEVGDTFLTRLGIEENVADCVIELNNRVVNQMGTRRIRIIKYRGSAHANNEYPFLIDENGMTIFPIISKINEQEVSIERILTGIPSLDEMLESKGYYSGSSILVSGTAGTGKTSITAAFAKKICNDKITCLFCVFEETPNQLMRNMTSIGINLEAYKTNSLLHFYYARPSLQNLELHFMAIKEQIEILKPGVVILDPITNLMTEGPNSDVRSMLTRFVDYLKTKQITVMFTAAITIGSISQNPSDEGISSMVDTWIMLQDIETEDERYKSLYVMKSRGMKHSKKVKEFIISSTGISLTPLIKNLQSSNQANYKPNRKIEAASTNGHQQTK
jgi:circadian clock protein KaiC